MQGLNWEFYEISGTPFKKKISNYLQLKNNSEKNRQRINSIKTCDTLQVKTENPFLIR